MVLNYKEHFFEFVKISETGKWQNSLAVGKTLQYDGFYDIKKGKFFSIENHKIIWG